MAQRSPWFSVAALSLANLLAASAFAQAQAPAAAAPSLAAAASPTAAAAPAPIQVEAKLSNTTPLFGEKVELRVTLRYPAGYRVFFPSKPDLRPLLVDTRDPGRSERQELAGQIVETLVLPALAVRQGAAKTPAIEIPWHRVTDQGGAGESGTVQVAPLRFSVKSQFANDTQVKASPLPPPRPLVEENTPLEIALLIAAMMALSAVMTAAGLKVYRDRAARRAPKPKVPAHVAALDRLRELNNSGRLQTASAREVFAELSEILRQYLGGRYRFAAIDMTTTELLAQLQSIEVRGVMKDELRAFAELSDLVKFAQVPAAPEELQREAAWVQRVVEKTMLTAEETEAQRRAEMERLARQRRLRLMVMAPAPLRARAFAVDVFIGALANALLAWVAIDTANQLLFDVSYAMLPLWLIVRDVLAGQSPGKTLVGLQIAKWEDELPDEVPGRASRDDQEDLPTAEMTGLSARLLRNLLLAVPLAGLVAEAVTCLYLPEMRRIGDQWANTRVIDSRYGSRRGVAGWIAPVLVALVAAGLLLLPLALGGRPS